MMTKLTGGPDPAFFPDPAERLRVDNFLTQRLKDLPQRIAQGRVAPELDLGALEDQLAAFNFAAPMPLEACMGWAIGALQDGIVQITHPRYFGLFNPAPTFPAECADRIVAAFNPQLAAAPTAPAAHAIERHVLNAVARRAGLPQGTGGHFTSGGSEANLTGLLLALTAAAPAFPEAGMRAFAQPPVAYVSAAAHGAWIKAAQQTGLGRRAVREIATDGKGRICPDALHRALAADREAGNLPVLVVATAGTTAAGMIDPLPACRAVAREAGAWFHVDAAWGGALLASPREAPRLAGLDQADSITIDAHKMFATTMSCGMLLTRAPALLARCFSVGATFMPSTAHDDPYMSSVLWSRRFHGLRLFLSLAAGGWPAYARHVERAIGLIRHLAGRLGAAGWTIANEPDLAVLCAMPPPGAPAPQAIAAHIVQSGEAWVSAAVFEGRPVVRICLSNGRSTLRDVDALHDCLLAHGATQLAAVPHRAATFIDTI